MGLVCRLACSPKGGRCCGESYCNPGETCCGKGCAPKGHSCCGPDKQCPEGTECCEDDENEFFCAEECMPTLTFPYVEDFLEEIYENMCLGTLAHSSTNDPNTAILTLESKLKDELKQAKAKRRRDARCTGSNKIQCGPGESCDEFPFASSMEGGSGAQIKCVPKWQNDWQGTYYNEWLKEQQQLGKLARGGRYRVKMRHIDCTKFRRRSLAARQGPVLSMNNNGNPDLTRRTTLAYPYD